MSEQSSRGGAANLTIPIVLVVFIVIVVLMSRMGGGGDEATEGEAPAAPAAAAPAATAAIEATPAQLQENPGQFTGRTVKITLPVAQAVGSQAFFLDVPRSPFLVKISEALAQQGTAVPTGTVTVEGPVLAMNDSIKNDWVAKGLVPEADVILVEFATHFIEARSIQAAAAAAPAP
jgi:hypothetical protein